MRAVVTRVKNASVVIGGQVNGQIGTGFLVLLGVGPMIAVSASWSKKGFFSV